MNLAGDLSYPLYLVHTLAISAFALGKLPATYQSLGIVVAVTIAAAAVVHLAIERPFARALHWVLGSSYRRAAQIAP